MAVNQTWTDPSTGGEIDLGTGETLPETVWDKVLSDIKAMGGTAGPPNTQATRGVFPVSGYVMGAIAHDVHIESGTVDVTCAGDRSGYAAVSFANAFASAPKVVATPTEAVTEGWYCTDITGSGFNLHDYTANTDVHTYHWIAIGSDV